MGLMVADFGYEYQHCAKLTIGDVSTEILGYK